MRRFAVFLAIFIFCFPSPALAGDFQADLYWDGNNIIVQYNGYEHGIINSGVEMWVTNQDTGETYYVKDFDKSINKPITELKTQTSGKIKAPQKYEKWTVQFKANGQTISRSVNCWTETHPETGESGFSSAAEGKFESGPIPIFMQGSWEVIKFWYYVLASLSGAFIFLALIRSGYHYMFSSICNPGLKASFSQTIERCIIGIVVIIIAPYLVNFLIQINDALVHLFANTLDHVATGAFDLDLPQDPNNDPWLARVVAWPFQALIDLVNTFFGLHPLGDVVFNGHLDSTILTNEKLFTGGLKTNNPFTQALLNLALLGFALYFNAVYTIRRWVVIAVMAVTPIIIWIWVLTSQRNVIELWLSELIQTIFMQTWHALTFGIFFSILCFTGGGLSISALTGSTDSTAQVLISIGKWIAGVGGIVCTGVIIAQGFKLAVAQTEKTADEVKQKIQNALIGLLILGLSLMIASFLTANQLEVLNPIIEEKETVKITFWQLFFVLFTIIPVSKMLSMVFMSILARFGTVDEHAEAGRASGMLAGLAALGGGAAAAARGKVSLPSAVSGDNIKPGSGSASAGGTASLNGGTISPGGTVSPGGGIISAGNNISGHSAIGTEQNLYSDLSSISGYKTGVQNDSGNTGNPYTEMPGIYEGEAPGICEDSLDTQQEEPDKGLIQARETDFIHILNQSQASVEGVAKGGAKLGYGAGMFTGTAQGMAAFLGSATKVAAAPIKTAFDLGMSVREQRLLAKGEPVSFTGRTTTAGAATQTLTAIALSPFGASGQASINAGRHIDKWFGGVDMYATEKAPKGSMDGQK